MPAREKRREVRQRQHGALAPDIAAAQLDPPVDVWMGVRLNEGVQGLGRSTLGLTSNSRETITPMYDS